LGWLTNFFSFCAVRVGWGVKIAWGNSTTQAAANDAFTLAKLGMGGDGLRLWACFQLKRPTRGKQLKPEATGSVLTDFWE